jgi:hypothetical protein
MTSQANQILKRGSILLTAAGLGASLSVAALAVEDLPDITGPDYDIAGHSYAVQLTNADMCELDFQGGGGTGRIYATCIPEGYMSGLVAYWSVLGERVVFTPVTDPYFFSSECENWTPLEVGETVSEVCWVSAQGEARVLSITLHD